MEIITFQIFIDFMIILCSTNLFHLKLKQFSKNYSLKHAYYCSVLCFSVAKLMNILNVDIKVEKYIIMIEYIFIALFLCIFEYMYPDQNKNKTE